MSMFKELYELALGATLTLTISADEKKGRMTVNVIPKPRADAGEPALSTPLVLTATPEEFDADFVTVLAGYRASHASLVQQAQVTQELLDAGVVGGELLGGHLWRLLVTGHPHARSAGLPPQSDSCCDGRWEVCGPASSPTSHLTPAVQ